MRSALFLAFATLPVLAPSALGQGVFADPAAIDRDVAAFTGAGPGLPGGAQFPVDRRLHLARCSAPLALSWRAPRQDTVQVQCPDQGGWRLFVPVRPREASQTVVARGEAVTIAVTGDGFVVSQPGEAMDSGAVGDWIRVRPVQMSGQTGGSRADSMRARIVRPGEVEVVLP